MPSALKDSTTDRQLDTLRYFGSPFTCASAIIMLLGFFFATRLLDLIVYHFYLLHASLVLVLSNIFHERLRYAIKSSAEALFSFHFNERTRL